jgi:hypothetical protein
MQELVIPIVFKPLAERSLNHTEVNHATNIVQVGFFEPVFSVLVDLVRFNMEVEFVVVPMQVAALALMANYTVACADFM